MIYATKIRDGDPKPSGKFPVGRPNTFHSCCPCPVTGRLGGTQAAQQGCEGFARLDTQKYHHRKGTEGEVDGWGC